MLVNIQQYHLVEIDIKMAQDATRTKVVGP